MNSVQTNTLTQTHNYPSEYTKLCDQTGATGNWYGNYGSAFVYFNGAWRGGTIWSKCHWLPNNGLGSC